MFPDANKALLGMFTHVTAIRLRHGEPEFPRYRGGDRNSVTHLHHVGR
jgi:hypothetical protein